MTSRREATKLAWVLLALLSVAGCRRSHAPPGAAHCSLTVFAAISLSDLVETVGQVFAARHPECVTAYNFGASNALGLQIEAGVHADVFLSAAQAPVDRLMVSQAIVTGARTTLFSNRLVVVSHASGPFALNEICELPKAKFRFLAIGQPDAVPVGIYAKEYLSKLNCPANGPLWNVLQDRLLPMPSARAVLSVVEGQADLLGIVYRTDALSSKAVKTQVVIEGPGAPRIDYFGLRIGSQARAAEAFLQMFFSPEIQAEISRLGFVVGSS